MPVRVINIETSGPLATAPNTGHNRWHEAIPPLATIGLEELVQVDLRDSGDRQVNPSTTLDEHRSVDLGRTHPLTGPLYVEGVAPGDYLDVEVVDIEYEPFGWSALYPEAPGLLADLVNDFFLARWDLDGGVARSRDVPAIGVPGRPFLGVIGVAPSQAHRRSIASAETRYAAEGGAVLLPSPQGAVPPTVFVENEGLRTMPARTLGGNLDITDVIAGSRILLPVEVDGALLSVGDLHFAQGDGEAPGLAIETGGRVRLRCRRRTADELRWAPTHPVIISAPDAPPRRRGRALITTGMSTGLDDTCHGFDLERAVRHAFRQMVEYLTTARGYTHEQALTITSICVDLRINAIGNTPAAVVTAVLPLDYFDDPEPIVED